MQLDELHTGLRYDSRIGDGSLRLYNRRNVHRFSGHEKLQADVLTCHHFLKFYLFSRHVDHCRGNLQQHPVLHHRKCRNYCITAYRNNKKDRFCSVCFNGQRPYYIRVSKTGFCDTNYDSEFVRYIDLSFGLFVCLFAIAVLIAVLIDSYMAELQRSKRYLLALEEKNREIEAKNQALEKSNAEFMKAKEEAEKLNLLLSEEKQKFERLSFTDHLTGAFNKRFITACLDKEVESSRKNHEKLTVAMVDIDNFKNINDTYGHMYGDYVLKRIAKTIKSSLRHDDIVGRYGGDEFFIILRNTGKEKGYAVVERIRKKILELEWESDLVVTISGGVADVGEKSTSELLMKVDRLLYIAKNKSKNSIEMEEDELPEG
jgi:diguanylate cyclase (GGDEF)-like protein